MVLESLVKELRNQRVHWFSDNQQNSPEWEQETRLTTFSMIIKHHMCVESEWIPRTLNQQAYWLSHIEDYDIMTELFTLVTSE